MELINRIKVNIVFICKQPGGIINTVVAAGIIVGWVIKFCGLVVGTGSAKITFWSNLNY